MTQAFGALRTEESRLCAKPMDDASWRRVLGRLNRRLEVFPRDAILQPIRVIEAGIGILTAPMEAYCRATCGDCLDPCCTGRKVFYNRADLLYLVALQKAWPLGQTRVRPEDPCRFLGHRGCLLPRHLRPYVCVWFLCEAQMELFQAEPPAVQRRWVRALLDIRNARLRLENLFESRFPGDTCDEA